MQKDLTLPTTLSLKLLKQVDLVKGEFIFRVRHNRRVEVYNERLDRWESELLDDLTATGPWSLKLRVAFTHARKVRVVEMALRCCGFWSRTIPTWTTIWS